MSIDLKWSALLLICLTAGIQSNAQDTNDDEEFNISIKPGIIQTKTSFNQLQVDYTDQAPIPNHILVDFSMSHNPVLYGGQVAFGSRLYHNGFYFDGLGFGFYLNRSVLFQYNTGFGYGIRLNKKWKLMASVSTGYGLYDKLLTHHYYTAANLLVINGKILNNEFQLDLVHHCLYTKPLIKLQYQIKALSFYLFGGYQYNPMDKERLEITENNHLVYTRPLTAHVSPGSSIRENGQYISGKIMNLNGFTFGLGVVLNVYY